MATFTNPDTVHRASTGTIAPATWGDTVNDDLNALYGDTAWTTVTAFTNLWAQSTETVLYRKVGTRVYLYGGITGGTAGATAFTLPTGYQPARVQTLMAYNATAGAAVKVGVTTAGAVQPSVSAFLLLENISFDTI